MSETAQISESAAWTGAQPKLSVLMPFLRDDPSDLLHRLDSEADALAGRVELVVLDDGTNDTALTNRLEAQLCQTRLPVRLITLTCNAGRSVGRNRLSSTARAGHMLFLDSDMRPDRPDFLQSWLALIETSNPAVAFGGFSLDQAPTDARFAVHRALALRGECIDAASRAETPEKYVFTSNLLVRRDVFDAEAFDPGFSGWGWEDVEWAMRVARTWPVLHPDIPATHMGLDTVPQLLAKYEQSAGNFARVVARHHDTVSTYPSYKVAKALRRLPARPLLRSSLKAMASNDAMPVSMRVYALKLYRAALYAEAV
jgi:Predicted glycosyltransferases